MKKKVNGVLGAALILFVVISFNTFVAALTDVFGLRGDLTEEKLFQLTDTTKEVLAGLEEDVTLSYFDEEDGSDTNLSELLKRYDRYSDRVSVRYVDLDANPAMAGEYRKKGITLSANAVLAECGENAQVIPWSEMYGYNTYKDADGNIRYNLTSFKAEKKITSAVAAVTRDGAKTVFLTQGHSENVSAELKELISDSNYQVKTGVLGVDGIDGAVTIIAAGPSRDFSEDEIRILDDFLEKGGSLIVFRNPGAGSLDHLDAYLAEWGLSADGTIVLEPSRQMDSPVNVIPDFAVHMINVYFSESSSYVVLPVCGSLTLSNPNGRLTAAVLRSTSSSYAKNIDSAATFEQEKSDAQGPFTLAATSEKTIQGNKEEKKAIVFLADCSDFYNDRWLENASLGNGQLILQALNYMNEETVTLAIPEKKLANEQIAVSWSASLAIGIVFLGIIPAAFILTGLAVFIRRRRA